MIKLKDLITEEWLTHKGKTMWFPAHTKPTMDWISGGQHVALYPKQVEELFGKQKVSSFHVTSPDHLRQLGKIIGKKKTISTFSKSGELKIKSPTLASLNPASACSSRNAFNFFESSFVDI